MELCSSVHSECKRLSVCVILTQVVAEASDLHTEDVSARDEKFWLPLIQLLDQSPCQVTHSRPTHTHNQLAQNKT